MDKGLETKESKPGKDSKIETPDGKSVYLFRYDNPTAVNRNPNSPVSNDEITGKWFTDSLKSLKTYILMRPPGGSVIVAMVPKDRLDQVKAENNDVAKDMDIEADNYILPDDLLANSEKIDITLAPGSPTKYLFTDRAKIEEFVDEIIPQIQDKAA